MPATRNDFTLASPVTRDSLYNSIKQGMAALTGLTLVEEYTASDDLCVVYRRVVDSTKTFGTIFYRIMVNNAFRINSQLGSSWTTSNKSLGNASSERNVTLSNSSPVTATAINDSAGEFQLLNLVQGTNLVNTLGLLVPANIPSWWDLNQFPYGFHSTDTTFTNWGGSIASPYNSSSYSFVGFSRLASANSFTARRDIVPGIFLFSNNNQGVAAQCSPNIAHASCLGTLRYDIIKSQNNAEYLIMVSAASGLVLRLN